MIKTAVQNLVNKIGEEEVKTEIKNTVEIKVAKMIDAEMLEMSKVGVKKIFTDALKKKCKPILDAIENLDISDMVSKIEQINIGSDVDGVVDTLDSKLKDKLLESIKQIDNIKVDMSQYNEKINAVIGEHVIDISEDDDDVEEAIKDKVLESVKNIKI